MEERAINPLQLAEAARKILDDKKGQEITLVDVRGSSTVTDYMLVVSGLSTPHLKALFNELQSELKKLGASCYRRSGDAEGGWMVLDYVDLVIHIFLPETRAFYGLEELWTARPEEI